MILTQTNLISLGILILVVSAGCSNFGMVERDTSTTSRNSPPTQVTEARETYESTTSRISTPTVTTSPPATSTPTVLDKYAERREKYVEFDEEYVNLADKKLGVEIVDTDIHPHNKTYEIKYMLGNPQNHSRSARERQAVALSYLVMVESWRSDKHPEKDHTWIPDRMNVTTVTSDGKVFDRRYIRYLWAYKYDEGLYSIVAYMTLYAGTLEKGPAYMNTAENATAQ